MSDLRTADERARALALDVTRSFIVQAPAGSGKTELLTRRFLALLATVEEPESVLAITFTRKAAAEMRDRILGALRTVSDGGPALALLHPQAVQLASAALATNRRLGWDLAANPGRLRIQTIDSLNLGLARRLPLLSGLGAGLGVEEDAQELYRLAAERLLSHLPGGEPQHSRAVATLLGHVDDRVQRFADLVVEMLKRREAWGPELPTAGDDEETDGCLRERLEGARRQLVQSHLESLVDAFPRDLLQRAATLAREAAAALIAAGRESPITAWAARGEVPGVTPADAPLWAGLAALLLTGAGEPRKQFDVRVGVPPGPAGQALKLRATETASALLPFTALVRELHSVRTLPDPRYDEREWQVLAAQLMVLRLAVAELEVVFAERRAADYPRFAAAARQALGTEEAPTDTALALDATLRHVLVDEFQDTSEAQVSLLEGLTSGWQTGDGRTLFLVGDPMQSIYRFRNAEVGLFLKVRDAGLGALRLEPLTLAVNFRSTEPLVDWFNDCFTQVLPEKDDELRGAVRYSTARSAEGAGADGGVRVHAFFQRSRLHEAESVANVVAASLREDDEARIGILVQGRGHLLHIVAELARRGIAFQATDIDPLAGRPAVLDLLSLTRAIAHPADRSAWLAVLRAPWCGLTLAQMHALCGDDHAATLPELLRDPGRRRRLDPDARARLDRAWKVLDESAPELRRYGLRDAVGRAWLALGGPAACQSERALDEAQAYLDQLADVERRASGMVDLAPLAAALERLYAPSRPDRSIRVELLTIHRAKGLQFDTVIVPGLERITRKDDPRLLHWTRVPGVERHELVVAPIAGTGAEPNRLYDWLAEVEAEKLRQERRRLLYVAATRARRWLHLFGSCRLDDRDGDVRLAKPAASTALGLLWPTVESEFVRRLAETGAVADEAAVLRDRMPVLRRLPVQWSLPSLPAPRVESSVSLPRSGEQVLDFDWATETTRHVGTVVHAELQRIASGGPRPAPGDQRTRRRRLDELAELGVPDGLRARAVERVETAVQRMLDDERGRWLLDPRHASSAVELALTGRAGGELVRVVVDRTFVDEDGARWIVDYKTSSHEGAGLDEFLDSEQQRYRPQLERYAELVRHLGPEPVRLGLYFPLLSAWRAWS